MERAKKSGVDGKSGRKEADMVAEVCAMSAQPRPARHSVGFYDMYVLHGLHFRPVQPGLVIASYKVPARLAVMLLRFVCKKCSILWFACFDHGSLCKDDDGNLCPGALGTIVDVAGGAAIMSSGHQVAVTVNMSIQYLTKAGVDDELEVTSRLLKYEGGYSSTSISVKNKSNGQLICICQQLCFNKPQSRI